MMWASPALLGWSRQVIRFAGPGKSGGVARLARRRCLRGERTRAETPRTGAQPVLTRRSWGAPHRGVPELLDGRVDQLVIARQFCLDGPGPLVGEHLDLAGLDGVADLLGD